MNPQRALIIFLFIVLAKVCFGQISPFYHRYPQKGTGSELYQDPDGSIWVAGTNDSWDVYLMKANAQGDTLWWRSYPHPHDDGVSALLPIQDGGFWMSGSWGLPDTLSQGKSNGYVMRVDSFGIPICEQNFANPVPNPGMDFVADIVGIEPDRWIISGGLYPSLNQTGLAPKSFLAAINGNCDTVWLRTHSQPKPIEGLQYLNNGTIIALGNAYPSGGDFCVLYDTAGPVLNTFSGSFGFLSFSSTKIHPLPNGQYWLCGNVRVGNGKNPAWVKLDSAFAPVSIHSFSNQEIDVIYDSELLPDGGLILVGETQTYATGPFSNTDIWLIRVDAHGDTLWTRTYGTTRYELAGNVALFPDGGFLITGRDDDHVFLMKTDSLGYAPYPIVGIEDPILDQPSFTVFPNPASDLIQISCFDFRPMGGSVMNMLGKRVMQIPSEVFQNGNPSALLSVGQLSDGIYWVELLNTDGRIYLQKFIKH